MNINKRSPNSKTSDSYFIWLSNSCAKWFEFISYGSLFSWFNLSWPEFRVVGLWFPAAVMSWTCRANFLLFRFSNIKNRSVISAAMPNETPTPVPTALTLASWLDCWTQLTMVPVVLELKSDVIDIVDVIDVGRAMTLALIGIWALARKLDNW